jgi:hypothetical protein
MTLAVALGVAFVVSAAVAFAAPILIRDGEGVRAAPQPTFRQAVVCLDPPQPTGAVPDPCWDMTTAAGRSTPSSAARTAAWLTAGAVRTELTALKRRQPSVCVTTATGERAPCGRNDIDADELRSALNRVGLTDLVVRLARPDDITSGKGLVFAARVQDACVLGYVLPSKEAAGVAGMLPDRTCLSR